MTQPEELESSRDLTSLNPNLAMRWVWITDMYRMMWPDEPQPLISHAFRGQADQDREYAEGDSELRWPNSLHNQHSYNSANDAVPSSMALDFYFNERGKTSYRIDLMNRVINLARLAGLFCGIDWPRLRDMPHLALRESLEKSAPLPRLPKLPAVADSATQPILQVFDGFFEGGTRVFSERKGDVLIRISNDPSRPTNPMRVQVRYDEGDEK